jgi:putative ABC transport system permease protein
MKDKIQLPAAACRLFKLFVPSKERDCFFAAIREVYDHRRLTDGRGAARLWFWGQLFRSLPFFIKNSCEWSVTMFGNYLKIAFRDMRKHKGYSFITIAGLAVGAACCILILLYVRQELNYDDDHKDGDRVYRVLVRTDFGGEKKLASLSELAGPELKAKVPGVEFAARVHKGQPPLFNSGPTVSYEDLVLYADADIFNILSIPFVYGTPAGALERPNTVLLTESLAAKYFGYGNPVGKTILIDNVLFELTGVVRDCPTNTHLKFRGLMSFNTLEPKLPMNDWSRFDFYTYIKIRPDTDMKAFTAKVAHLSEPYLKEKGKTGSGQEYLLQPISSIHLDNSVAWDIDTHANAGALFLIAGLGVVILLIACMNFVNLTTARSSGRAKEVGVRKVVGAEFPQLVKQFLGESFLSAFFAVGIALALAGTMLARFNRLAETRFSTGDLFRPGMFAIYGALLLFAGLAAGVYPALFLSSFKPVSVLKNDAAVHLKGGGLRRFFVTGQFTVAVALIICTMVMNRQIHFMKNKPLGFDKEQKLVVVFPGPLGTRPDKIPPARQAAIKQEFSRHPSVRSATLSSSVPGRGFSFNGTRLPSQEPKQSQRARYLLADENFIKDYGLEVLAGRPFAAGGSDNEILINEKTLGAFGWKTPEEALGQRMSGLLDPMEIIGVVRDFHQAGLRNPIEPLVIGRIPRFFHMVTLTFDASALPAVLDHCRRTWRVFLPDSPFQYFFLDEDFSRQYQNDEKTAFLFSVFAGLGIVIACLGLFGLASFLTQKRTKEIGIRKVLGASVPSVFCLVSKDFALWVVLSNVFAWPVAYFAANQWLRNFAYRIAVGPWVFLTAGGLVLAVAILSVSWQSIKTARANPVDSLRYE